MTHRMTATLLLGLLALLAPPHLRAEEPVAVRGLVIEIEEGAHAIDAATPASMDITFHNKGEEPLQLYLPRHATLVPFPQWTFTAASGEVFVPRGAPFQSMFRKGLQGSILRLAPGGSHAHKLRLGAFRKLDASGKASRDPQSLSPGTYTVRARYLQPTTEVPYADSMSRSVPRAFEGLWTGDVTSRPVKLVVKPGKQPVLTLSAPQDLASGAAIPVRMTLTNHGDEPLRVRAALELSAGTKAYGTCFARFVISGDGLQPVSKPGHTHMIEVGPGQSLSRTVDLAAVDMRARKFQVWHGADEERGVAFHDVISEGSFRITAHLVDELGNTLAQGGIRRVLRPLAVRTDVLDVRVERRGLDHRQGPVVEVIVTNKGGAAVRLPAALHYPANVFFSLEAPGKRGVYRLSLDGAGRVGGGGLGYEPGQRARIAAGLAWRLGACEPRGGQLQGASVLLPPGGELRRRFRLAELVDAGELLKWGPFQLTAYYRNRESGARMGLEDFFVGLVPSKPVEVRGGGW